MGIEHRVKHQIIDSWKNKQVANWVIDNLPLLEAGLSQPSCPVYTFSLERGLVQKHTMGSIQIFRETPKLVISGGFEGTMGHLRAVSNLHEIRALTTNGNCELVLMLEPDSYIRNTKKREPLVNLFYRERLWSTSGLIDAVVLIPDSSLINNTHEYFSKFSEYLGPLRWCTSIENPAWEKIIVREDKNNALDISQVFDDELYVHASLLASSKNMDPERVKQTIYDDILNRVMKMESPDLLQFIPAEELAKNIFDKVAKDL